MFAHGMTTVLVINAMDWTSNCGDSVGFGLLVSLASFFSSFRVDDIDEINRTILDVSFIKCFQH